MAVPKDTICGIIGAKPVTSCSSSGRTVSAPCFRPPNTSDSTGISTDARPPIFSSAPSITGVAPEMTPSSTGMIWSATLEIVSIIVVPSFWIVGMFFMITAANLPCMERTTFPTSSFMSPYAFAICWILPWSVCAIA